MPANMSEMCRGGGARCGTRFSWRVGVLWSKLAAHLCCHLQDGVIWRGRPPTRSLPNHAHHQGQERSHKPEAATHDGNRWHTHAEINKEALRSSWNVHAWSRFYFQMGIPRTETPWVRQISRPTCPPRWPSPCWTYWSSLFTITRSAFLCYEKLILISVVHVWKDGDVLCQCFQGQ